jgi:hypothetical protein
VRRKKRPDGGQTRSEGEGRRGQSEEAEDVRVRRQKRSE